MEEESWLVLVARALADPTRYRMLHEIRAAGEMTCGELKDRFPLSQATVSHHIKTLQQAGLLRVRAEGLFRHLSAEPDRLAAFATGVVAELGAPAAGKGAAETGAAESDAKTPLPPLRTRERTVRSARKPASSRKR